MKKLYVIAIITLILVMVFSISLAGGRSEDEQKLLDEKADGQEIIDAEKDQMVNFQTEWKTLEDIKDIIKSENKMGFLYFHSNCGICKSMEENFFTNSKVIEFIESNFVPFYIDVNKSNSSKVGDNFKVTSYPTVIFINSEGNIIDRMGGYSGQPAVYLKKLEESINNNNTLIGLKEKYEANPENIELALKYANKLRSSDNYNEAINMYENLIDNVEGDSLKDRTYYYLGICYEYAGDSDKANGVYIKGLDKGIIKEFKEEVYWRIGNIYFKNEEYYKAIKYYEMIPKRAEEFGFFNKTPWTKYGIERIMSTAKERLPMLYIKIDDKRKGKDPLEK